MTANQNLLEIDGEYATMETRRGHMRMNLQFFSEKDIANQESSSLKRAIRKYEKRINEHKSYISNPRQHVPDWDSLDPRMQEGLKKHWRKEVKNFEQSIHDRIDELKRRGDYE